MSQTDSFIDEVSEEVRRDRLYALARRYGWMVALVLVLIVGGAGFLEWQKAQQRAAAQAKGDQIFAALDSGTAASRAAALSDIDADGVAGALVQMLAAAELAQVDVTRSGEMLKALTEDPDLPPVYQQLALLKLIMLRDYPMFSDEKISRLEPMTAPGAPFRVLAMEQLAMLHMDNGETDKALDLLRPIMTDADASPAQRLRAQQVFIVLGGDLEGA